MIIFFYLEITFAAIAALCLLCFVLLFLFVAGGKRVSLSIEHSDERARFAIIIPARYESLVIRDNLRAIKNSDYPMELVDIYVIVENMADPTVKICKELEGVNVFLRRDLSKIGKGHALDECVCDIFSKNDVYDAFMILDADNVIAPDFISKMNDAYMAGYEAACGKRNNKDWNASAVSASSGLTFVIINDIQNKRKTARKMGITFTGTGFYVSADVLRRLGGWKFYSLTEDYEFSTFAMCNGIKSCYVQEAVYYDEQPRTWWQSIIQRTRWVKGYFAVRFGYRRMKKEYAKSCPKNKDIISMRLGTLPAISLAVVTILYFISNVVGAIISGTVGYGQTHLFVIRICAVLAVLYIGIMVFTAYLFHMERHSIKISKWNEIKAVIYSPIYWVSYVVAVIRTIFIKNEWEVIEHSITNENGEI